MKQMFFSVFLELLTYSQSLICRCFLKAAALVQQGERGRRGRVKPCQKGEPGAPGLGGQSVRLTSLS